MKYYIYLYLCASMSFCRKNFLIETKDETDLKPQDGVDRSNRTGEGMDYWGIGGGNTPKPRPIKPLKKMDCQGKRFFLQADFQRWKFVKDTCKVRTPSLYLSTYLSKGEDTIW